jgi:mycothiol S-conjugate amidase
MAAWEAAGDPDRYPEAGAPHAPAKLYYTLFPRRQMLAVHEKFVELGLESPFDDKWLERLRRHDDVTTSVDLTGFADVRGQALLAHATQVDPNSPFWFGLPPEVRRSLHPYDEYLLARSRVGRVDVTEDDLFAGIG